MLSLPVKSSKDKSAVVNPQSAIRNPQLKNPQSAIDMVLLQCWQFTAVGSQASHVVLDKGRFHEKSSASRFSLRHHSSMSGR
jgi:hypothetical protein